MVNSISAPFVFELTGGHLALDLANTREKRPTPTPEEHLNGYSDLVAWALQSGALDGREAARLTAHAARHPHPARRAWTRALELREALFEAFSDTASGRRPGAAALARINAALPEALSRLRLAPAGNGAAWAWSDEPDLNRPWWPVVRAGAELLASAELSRLRECAASDCAWLFLDHSRNGSRRWCDMSVCGNREKARRFRRHRRPHP